HRGAAVYPGYSKKALASFVEARSSYPANRRWTRDAAATLGRIGPPASTARHDLGVNPRGRGRTRRGGRDQAARSDLSQDRRSPLNRGAWRDLSGRANTRVILSVIRQPPADRKLRRHHADALPERRDGPRSSH